MWTKEDSEQAAQEGWDMFAINADQTIWQLQRDDEAGVFPTDIHAFQFAYRKALTGSRLHKKALQLDQDGIVALALIEGQGNGSSKG